MFKKLIIFFPLLLGLGLAALFWNPSAPRNPLPYRFKDSVKLLLPSQHKEAQESTLLIIGDRHGQFFSQYLPLLRKKLNPLFRNMLILNVAQEHHGIHRSLKKLQELPSLPTFILFLGGYDEFHEKKFNLGEYAAIKKNFLTFEDNSNIILMNLFPFLTSFMTERMSYHRYGPEIHPAKDDSDPVNQQRNLELRFKIYEWEVQELIDQVEKKQRKLILTTAPINLQTSPREVCSNATTVLLGQKLSALENRLDQGHIKTTLTELSSLQEVILGHAGFYYLLGKAYLQQGEFKSAQKYLARANSFDCAPSGSSHILNNILRSKAEENAVTILDWDKMSSASLGKATLFQEKGYLQESYYDHFLDGLATLINEHLKGLQHR